VHATVRRLPDASRGSARVVGVEVARHPDHRAHPVARRADEAVGQGGVRIGWFGLDRCRHLGRLRGVDPRRKRQQDHRRQRQETQSLHPCLRHQSSLIRLVLHRSQRAGFARPALA
jgi:hypothetical protein